MRGLRIRAGRVCGVAMGGDHIEARAVILATGHSARDVYEFLASQEVALESKPFAMGVRVEHPQALINEMQYNRIRGARRLPAAEYRLVARGAGLDAFSFCMCPGGRIVAATTCPGELVVNGMSVWARDSGWANSGVVVSVDAGDPLEGLELQRRVERAAWDLGGGGGRAPAQPLRDFLARRTPAHVGPCSYRPGVVPAAVHSILPPRILDPLCAAFAEFGRRFRGFCGPEAVVLAPETRTSSPVRIPRTREGLMHPGVEGLFPAGEGAGHAGGIVSSALDGERCADAVTRYLRK